MNPNTRLPRRPRVLAALVLPVWMMGGCATLFQRGPSHKEQITQVMNEWAEGWKVKDVSRIAPLLENSYTGLFDDTKGELLGFLSRHKDEAEAEFHFSTDEMVIEIHDDTAVAKNIQLSAQMESGWTSKLAIDYSLHRGDEKIWRISGAARGESDRQKEKETEASVE